MKYLTYLIYALFFVIIAGAGAVFFGPSLPILEGVEVKIVKSGSMEPAIATGGIVVVRPAAEYRVGDVITYTDRTADIPTTHRIMDVYMENGTKWFVTKGDANEDVDIAPVALGSVLGRVIFSMPYAGYVIDFARQPMGFAALIATPALLIVFGELEKIRAEVWGRRREGRREDEREEEPEDVPERPAFVPEREYAPVLAGAYDTGELGGYTLDLRGRSARVVREAYRYGAERVATARVASVRYIDEHTLDLRRRLVEPVERRVRVEAAPVARLQWLPAWATPVLVLVLGVAVASANFVPYTVSYFSSTVQSTGNVFKASDNFGFDPPEPFAFSVEPESVCRNYTLRQQGNVIPSGNFSTTTTFDIVPDTSGSEIQYVVSIENRIGDACGALEVGVGAGTAVPLANFSFSSTHDGSWSLPLTFSNGSALNTNTNSCTMDIRFSATFESASYATTSQVIIRRNTDPCPVTQTLSAPASFDATMDLTATSEDETNEIQSNSLQGDSVNEVQSNSEESGLGTDGEENGDETKDDDANTNTEEGMKEETKEDASTETTEQNAGEGETNPTQDVHNEESAMTTTEENATPAEPASGEETTEPSQDSPEPPSTDPTPDPAPEETSPEPAPNTDSTHTA